VLVKDFRQTHLDLLEGDFARKYGSDLREHDAPGDRRVAVTVEPTSIFAVDMSR